MSTGTAITCRCIIYLYNYYWPTQQFEGTFHWLALCFLSPCFARFTHVKNAFKCPLALALWVCFMSKRHTFIYLLWFFQNTTFCSGNLPLFYFFYKLLDMAHSKLRFNKIKKKHGQTDTIWENIKLSHKVQTGQAYVADIQNCSPVGFFICCNQWQWFIYRMKSVLFLF